MPKFRVKNNRQIIYPDGSLRGERGYILDSLAPGEQATLESQSDSLERAGRQAPVSPIDQSRMIPAVEKAAPKKKVAKKKAAKKKAAKED